MNMTPSAFHAQASEQSLQTTLFNMESELSIDLPITANKKMIAFVIFHHGGQCGRCNCDLFLVRFWCFLVLCWCFFCLFWCFCLVLVWFCILSDGLSKWFVNASAF